MTRKKRRICYNCKHRGNLFRINGLTHLHCQNPDIHKEEEFESGKKSAWDTLCEFWWTCRKHEFKEIQP